MSLNSTKIEGADEVKKLLNEMPKNVSLRVLRRHAREGSKYLNEKALSKYRMALSKDPRNVRRRTGLTESMLKWRRAKYPTMLDEAHFGLQNIIWFKHAGYPKDSDGVQRKRWSANASAAMIQRRTRFMTDTVKEHGMTVINRISGDLKTSLEKANQRCLKK